MKPQQAIRDTAGDFGPSFTLPPALIAEALDAAEREQEVTFLALPTKTLNLLRDVWEMGDDDVFKNRITVIVRDLFDGKDGHLTLIDEVLPR